MAPDTTQTNLAVLVPQIKYMLRQHRYAEAEAKISNLLTDDPQNPELLALLGQALMHQTKFDAAVIFLRRSLTIDSTNANILLTTASVLLLLRQPDEALNHLHQAQRASKDPKIPYLIGRTLIGQNRETEGIQTLKEALAKTLHIPTVALLVNTLAQRQRWSDIDIFLVSLLKHLASVSFDQKTTVLIDLARELRGPQFSKIREQLVTPLLEDLAKQGQGAPGHASALEVLGRLNEASEIRETRLKQYPDDPHSHLALGRIRLRQNNFDACIFHAKKCEELGLEDPETFTLLGQAYNLKGEIQRSEQAFYRAISIDPTNLDTLHKMAMILIDHRKSEAAHKLLIQLVELDPLNPLRMNLLLTTSMQLCHWDETDRCIAAIPSLGVNQALPPWGMLAYEDHPERQQKRSELWWLFRTKNKIKFKNTSFKTNRTAGKKIRVGYLSADFHNHATMFLMAGMVREHDRDRFEFVWISFGKFKTGEIHRTLKAMGDEFLDIQGDSYEQAVKKIRGKKLDVAIDLKGFTQDERCFYFKQRLAMLHIQYLGYPGTLGTEDFDYLIGDPVVIPPEQRKFYTESIIYLPHSYQCTDDQRSKRACDQGRSMHGLPEKGFILCCFNQSLKIQVAEFTLWLDILEEESETFLWMIEFNQTMVRNLKYRAECRSINPERLIFSKKIPQEQHLARHVHADLCIDTFFYNAHTTASDALWMGVPFVTKAGNQFASRVCASLLTAVGLPELVTRSNTEYKNMIINLIRNPKKLEIIREKLRRNLDTTPLFDSTRFTKNFERGLHMAVDMRLNNEKNNDLFVSDSAAFYSDRKASN